MVSVLAPLERRLAAAGVEDARFDAAQLFTLVTGKNAFTQGGAPLSPAEAARLDALVERRCRREPLQYICGEWDFLDLTLTVGPGVLIPRADTELAAETAIAAARAAGSAPEVLDLCAGTGCIALAVARHAPGARVRAVELYPRAFSCLEQNNARYGGAVLAVRADVFSYQARCAPESLDVIVANPPYIAPAEMDALAPELRFEPREALCAEGDGLSFYRHIAPAYRPALKKGGALILEIGSAQGPAVADILCAAGYADVRVLPDLAGLPRCVSARKGSSD